MAQLTPWVHRYTFRELMDDSLDLFKERVSTLLLVGLLPYLLVLVFDVLMRTFVLPGNLLQNMEWASVEALLGNVNFWLYLSGLATVWTIAVLLSLIAQCRVAIAHTLGEPISFGRVHRLLFKPWWSLLVIYIVFQVLASLILSVVMTIGIVAAAIAGLLVQNAGEDVVALVIISIALIFLVISWGLVSIGGALFIGAPIPPVHEHTGPFTALGRTARYASANFKAHAGALLVALHIPMVVWGLLGLIGGLIYIPFQHIEPLVGEIAISTITTIGFPLTTTAVLACLAALAYLDGECRTQALDLRLLADRFGFGAEVEQFFRTPQQAAAQAAGYPNYLAAPHVPAAPAAPAPQVAGAFPDYTAPPPVAPAPAVEAVAEAALGPGVAAVPETEAVDAG